MSRELNVAVVGATGLVGEALIEILEARRFPIGTLYPLASHRSIEKTVNFQNKALDVLDLAEFDFSKVELVFFSAGKAVSEQYAPIATQHNAIVIDNTSAFRYEEDIPLVIPEVNPERIQDFQARGIIANPNCSTLQMLVALKPIQDAVGIQRIHVSTYQAVSGTGRSAVMELIEQTRELLNGRPAEASVFPEQIAFNAIPHIDQIQENGFTREEMKLVWETQKIFEDPDLEVNATAVRIPVFYGHSESVYIETKKPLSVGQTETLLKAAQGVHLVTDQDKPYHSPMKTVGGDLVSVGRIRQDPFRTTGMNLWIVSDNIRKGAALNSVQIAENLVNNYW